MLKSRFFRCCLVATVTFSGVGASAWVWAQQPDATAAESLSQAVRLFEEGDYVGAQHALNEIDPDALSQQDQERLDEYTQRAAIAVSMQRKADADHEAAALAVSDGNYVEAMRLLRSVLGNQYAAADVRAAAQTELATLQKRHPVREEADKGRAKAAEPAVESHEQHESQETASGGESPESKAGEEAHHAAHGEHAGERAMPSGESQVAPGRADEMGEAAEPGQPSVSGSLRSLRAKVLTRDGVAAMRAGRLSEAERLFRQALANVPGYPEAQKGLATLSQYERVESSASGLLSRIRDRNAVAWQRTVATFRMLEREVRDHVLNDRYDQARQAVLRARQVVESGRSAADPAAKYEALLHDAEALKRYVEQEERVFNEREIMRQRDEARSANEQRLRQIRENKEQRINALMSQAQQLRKDRDYEGAINVLKQVVAIDPKNSMARWQIDSLEDQYAYVRQREVRDEFLRQSQAVLIDADRAKIPWWQDITYPKNWLEIISRPTRSLPGSETRGIDPSLQSKLDTPVRIDFPNAPFSEVITRLAGATGTNISVNWNSLAAASIDRNTPVSLSFSNPVSLGTALREVIDNVNATHVEVDYLPIDGVIKLASRDALNRTLYEQVYAVQDLLMPIPDFNDAPRMDLKQTQVNPATRTKVIAFGGGQAVFPEEGEEGAEELIEEHANELVALIRKTIDPESWRANGGDLGSIQEINGQLVITQTPSAQARIGGLLARLREQRSVQIAIEARFITVQSNYLEELGLDLDVVLNAGNAGFDFLAGAGGGLQVDPVLGSRLLLPRSFSRLGFTPGTPNVGNALTTAGPFQQPFSDVGLVPGRGNSSIGGRTGSPIPVISNILQFTDPGGLTSDLPGSFAGNPTLQPAFNIFGSFLDNIQVDFLIRATQADSRTTIVTAPKLVLWNGQRAWVAVVNQQSFVSSLQPVVDADGQAPIISTIETGAVLDAQATVAADRRYVTMTLRPSLGRLLGIQTFGFSIGPNVGEGAFVQLPNITRTVVRTTVSVPDGGTLLIGGQKLAGEIEVESGVPILSKIPLLKRLYSAQTLVKDEQILLILIKPRIIIPSEAEQEAFPTFSSR